MPKKKVVRFCWKCGEDTTHELVETERCFEGAARIFLGIMTLGSSEINNVMNCKYQCTKCGKIRNE